MLSLSPVQRNLICQDIFSAQLYVHSEKKIVEVDGERISHLVSDKMNRDNEHGVPQHLLTAVPIVTPVGSTDDIFWNLLFYCGGFDFKKRKEAIDETIRWSYFSFAFQTKWFYREIPDWRSSYKYTLMNYFVVLSPDPVKIEQTELEKRFLKVSSIIGKSNYDKMTHQICRKLLKVIPPIFLLLIEYFTVSDELRRESPEYVRTIENQGLSSLSTDEKLLLCASILSSPAFRYEQLEFSLDWIHDTRKNFDLNTKLVSFTSEGYKEKVQPTRCVLCKAFENGTKADSKSTNLYLTDAQDDKHSILVLKEETDGIFVYKYFKNNAILMTASRKMNYSHLFVNFMKG